jgi:predicted Mrr-cat superfamily restriction endonuclease
MENTLIVEDKTSSKNNRIWVVRAGRGSVYYRHFKSHKLVAIGHTQHLPLNISEGIINDISKENIITKYHTWLNSREQSKSTISNQVGQVRRFLNQVQIGDTVMTISDYGVLVGRIASECKFDSAPLTTHDVDDICEYPLRYDVVWGNEQPRKYIPYIVEQSFKNTGTIFTISGADKLKAIHHWLNPIHISNGEVRCTVNIQSKKELSNRQLTKLSILFDKLEVLTDYLEQQDNYSDVSFDIFESHLNKNIDKFDFKLTTQHDFMSPGFQFFQLPGDSKRRAIFAVVFATLFNCQVQAVEGKYLPEGLTEAVAVLVDGISKKEDASDVIESLKADVLNKVQPKALNELSFPEPSPSKESML